MTHRHIYYENGTLRISFRLVSWNYTVSMCIIFFSWDRKKWYLLHSVVHWAMNFIVQLIPVTSALILYQTVSMCLNRKSLGAVENLMEISEFIWFTKKFMGFGIQLKMRNDGQYQSVTDLLFNLT